jgi:ethanolamine ammonia-lyase small subunit
MTAAGCVRPVNLRRCFPADTMNDLIPQPASLRESLRSCTSARVGLGAAGAAVSTADQLNFQLDHAMARDAVHASLDVRSLLDGLAARKLEAVALKSEVDPSDRQTYLRRPDLGRRLHADSIKLISEAPRPDSPGVVFVIVDGLSALAVERHALPLLDETLGLLTSQPWRVGPVCILQQGRVAIGDEIGSRLGADMTVVLIGERPGLSAADSLGIYLTWQPRLGRTDAERNCISNIRAEGLSYRDAAERIVYYMNAARRLGATGIALKETAAIG